MGAREELAESLQVWRKNASHTQESAASELDVDPSQISRWENGKQLPKQTRAKDIARVYGIDRAEVSEKIGAAHEEVAVEGEQAMSAIPMLAERIAAMQRALDEVLRRLPPG